MTGVRGRYRAGRSGSRPNSSGSTAASTSSTATPHISGDISLASLPSVSPVATPAVASSPTLPTESPKWEQDEAFKKRSAQASLNRLSETGGLGAGPSRHTGGSISSAEHKRRMTHEFGREPTLIELFERTHSKKTEEGQIVYVDRRSSSVAEMYGQLLE
ncbi:uncharacterized protein LOC127787522 [Diospyros lotus]|uniref:uncharacterized protein LOC127787522 n=1 Tax=Diospyros lotus TaxID=55363 RepID=UPI00225234BB|nr:uncharacterized protein LOC127787522 [Diospyros lotus]